MMNYFIFTVPTLGVGTKIGFSLGLLALATTSTAFSFISYNAKTLSDLEAIKKPSEDFLNDIFSGLFTTGGGNIYKKYEEWTGKAKKENIKDNFDSENIDRFNGAYKSWIAGAKTLGSSLNDETIQDINYYLFKLGGFTKAVLKTIPYAFRDSIFEEVGLKRRRLLFGYRQIKNLVGANEFKKFTEEIKKVIKKHESIVDQLTAKDGTDVLNILKHISQEESKAKYALKSIADRAKTAEGKNYSSYSNPKEELLKDLFVGDWKIIKQKVEETKKGIEALKEVLEKIEELGVGKIEEFTEIINQLISKLPEAEIKEEAA